MHAAERLLFRENLSNGQSAKVYSIPSKYTRYTVYRKPLRQKLRALKNIIIETL